MNFNEFYQALSDTPPNRIVFVGLGNPQRGDDAAGLVLTQRLMAQNALRGARFIQAGTNPENYTDKIVKDRPARVIFIDAAQLHQPAGTIIFVDQNQLIVNQFSTHTYSVSVVAAFCQARGAGQCRFLAIQPAQTNLGQPLSVAVEQAINRFFNSEPTA